MLSLGRSKLFYFRLKVRILTVALLCSSIGQPQTSHADESVTDSNVWPQTVLTAQKYPLMGHNISPTSYVLPKGRASIGFYSLSFGLSDNVLLSTSPWLLVFYNMPSAGMKYSAAASDWASPTFSRGSFEAIWFKTTAQESGFRQNAIWLRATGTHEVSSNYSLHTTASFQYYMDETRPFSLRYRTVNEDPFGISVGLLHELHVHKNVAFQLETAVLNINDWLPVYHFGASVILKGQGGFFQIGASLSHRPQGPYSNEQLSDGAGVPVEWVRSYQEERGGILRTEIHPEVQIQVFL